MSPPAVVSLGFGRASLETCERFCWQKSTEPLKGHEGEKKKEHTSARSLCVHMVNTVFIAELANEYVLTLMLFRG